MEELRTKAQKVMQVLEKPEVIAALCQDKAENLQYLRDNYQVRHLSWTIHPSLTQLYSLLMTLSISCMNLVNSNTTVVIMEELLIICIITVF
jgi:hypothetical protein